MEPLKVVLVATGDEVTNGDILDSNSAWLAEHLFQLGVPPYAHEVIPDDPLRLQEAMERLSQSVDVAVFCGGLGPTQDDYTVDTVARWIGTQPEHHEPTLERARAYFASRGVPFVLNSARQCRIPAGTEVCPNPVGLAPAFWLKRGQATLFFLPGPPREFKACCQECVLPFIGQQAQSRGAMAVAAARFRTTEMGESLVAQAVAHIVDAFPDARFGWRAAYPEVWFKVLTQAADEDAARARLEEITTLVKQALPARNLFGRDDETMEQVVGKLLLEAKLTVGTAESCTGGLLGAMLTSVPGSSAWFAGGLVTYSNELKVKLLGVPQEILAQYGAVSEPCAIAMARGARRVLGTDLAVAITGIAGPDGGTPDKPVGTVFVALDTPDGTICEKPSLRPPREQIRTGAAFWALNKIRMYLSPTA